MLKYKQTSINITNDGGFSTITNEIRYTISADLNDAVEVQELFKDKVFEAQGDTIKHTGIISVPDMWGIINLVRTAQSDVDLTKKDDIIKFANFIIFTYNILDLNLNDWRND